MAVSLDNAQTYFDGHLSFDDWFNSTDKQRALDMAENLIQGSFTLRDNFADSLQYEHAVYEQAIYMIQRDKERWKLQNEGVSEYYVDDLRFKMSESLFSPITKMFLKPLIYKQVGYTSC